MSNNIHRNRYDAFIESRKERELKENDYVEKHHIVPRSLGGTDDDSNTILLSGREHFIAHLILWKCGTKEMMFAFYRMVHSSQNGSKDRLSSRQYEQLRIAHAEAQSELMKGTIRVYREGDVKSIAIPIEDLDRYLSEGYTKGIPFEGSFKGKHHSRETRKRLSEIQKTKVGESSPHFGKKHSDETKKKMSRMKTGRIWCYKEENGVVTDIKMVDSIDDIPPTYKRGHPSNKIRNMSKEERSELLGRNKGDKFSKATCSKMSKDRTGCRWMTDGVKSYFVRPKDISTRLHEGLEFGQCKNK